MKFDHNKSGWQIKEGSLTRVHCMQFPTLWSDSGEKFSPRAIIANFVAFHNLLQKNLYPWTRNTSRFISLPTKIKKTMY